MPNLNYNKKRKTPIDVRTAYRTKSFFFFFNVQLFKQKILMISLIFKYPQNIFIIYNNTIHNEGKKQQSVLYVLQLNFMERNLMENTIPNT